MYPAAPPPKKVARSGTFSRAPILGILPRSIRRWPSPTSPAPTRDKYVFSPNSLVIVTGNFDRRSGESNSLISFGSGSSSAEETGLRFNASFNRVQPAKSSNSTR